MDDMLPAPFTARPSLADVLTSSLAAVLHEPNRLGLAPVRSAVVILVDGLGVDALRRRAGHARFLAGRLAPASILVSGFPTTTAAGIATLCTGVPPGRHGLVGYRVFDAEHDRVVNQLSGWDERMLPEAWQRHETVFERASSLGIACHAIGQRKHSSSGFTRAVLRGAAYVGANGMAERFDAARALLRGNGAQLIYLYLNELDVISHASGCESDAWLTRLEDLDALVAAFARGLRSDEAAVLVADHGVLDVPHESQVLFDLVPELVAGVRHVAGEPRCLQLHLEPGSGQGAADRLAEAWRTHEGDNSWIATREEAVAAGWFGPEVDAVVLPRIGDVIVAARRRVAYYDSRISGDTGRAMIGQHGSLTPEETRVPLIRLGAAG